MTNNTRYFIIDRLTIVNMILINEKREIMTKLYNDILKLEQRNEIINKIAVSEEYQILFYYTADNRIVEVQKTEESINKLVLKK